MSGNILSELERLSFKSGGLIRVEAPMWTARNRGHYESGQLR